MIDKRTAAGNMFSAQEPATSKRNKNPSQVQRQSPQSQHQRKIKTLRRKAPVFTRELTTTASDKQKIYIKKTEHNINEDEEGKK